MEINKKRLLCVLLGIGLIILLTITYWTNFLNPYNGHYGELSSNSEMLVTGAIYHQYRGGGAASYGLGLSSPANITATRHNAGNYLTDEEKGFVSGFCITAPVIAVADNETDRANYVVGNVIAFATGIKCEITEVTAEDIYLYVTYDYNEVLTEETAGTLELARVYDTDGNLPAQSVRGNYESQYGLQGKVFRKISVLFPVLQMRNMLKLICAAAMALVAVGIIFLLKKKFGIGMAVTFFFVFLLSPWIVGFASNMYWLESLLFLPMLIGLWCSLQVEKRYARILSYIGGFGAIFVKSLCGYEYITVVMMSLVVFLLADVTIALLQKANQKKKILLFRTIFMIGVSALLGFFAALLIHARIRGNGDIGAGLLSIYEKDVLRRTLGGSAGEFDPAYAESLNETIGSVLAMYFDFTNSPYGAQLVLGISGKWFPVLAVLSSALVIGQCIRRKKVESVHLLYFWMLLSGISWFVLGKAHSVVHTHLNYLMWYFGYVQMIFYVVGRCVVDLWRKMWYNGKKHWHVFRNEEGTV